MPALKSHWKKFASQKPGRRFRNRYDQRRSGRSGRSWWWRALNVVGGLICLAIAVLLTIAPGPALPFYFVGGLLLANESRIAAGVLDWIDVRVSPLVRFIERHWKRLSPRTRRVATFLMVTSGVLSMAAGFYFMR